MKYAPYSHSRIQRGHCPFAFKRSYIDRAKGIQRGNAGFGGVIHLIIADVIKANVDEAPYDLTALINKHIVHELLPRIKEIQEILDVFRLRFKFTRENVVGVEEKIAIDVNGNEVDWDKAWFRGILDLIEIDGSHAIITDHKTQFNILSQDEMDNNDQLTAYCYLAKKMYPQIESFTVKIFFARYGAYRSSKRELKDIDLFDQQLRISIGKIEEIEEWVPIAGASCNFCDYIHECPLAQYDPKGTDLPAVLTHAQAVETARLIKVREEQVKKAKGMLQEYCAHNGTVEASGDFAYGYVKSQTTDWPLDDVKRVLDSNDQDILEHVTISKRSMNKLLSRSKRLDPDLAAELESVAIPVTSTSFRGHKLP